MKKRTICTAACAFALSVSATELDAYAREASDATLPDPVPPPATGTPASRAPQSGAGSESLAEQRWYGWQTLIVDGASLSLLVYSLSYSETTVATSCSGPTCSAGTQFLALSGLSGYVLGAPILHWAHGNVGRGFGSLGLRLVLPPAGVLVGGLVGCAINCSGGGVLGPDGPLVGGMIGSILGAGTAVFLDAELFAYEAVPLHSSTFVVSPVALRGGLGLSSSGTW